ncbi:ribokinase [Arboricoccus pini]|uniref:Deoxyribokinase n=1 Tax=Arboricoccus pini TaxID=1963835 RepID=A0A212RWW0_9PROT|nr:ribokinase [Arboricoccus pini]SNB77211.1 ribokinase [Arboricoccus pini]
MAGLIAVVGSNMVDLVTYLDRMPVAGETLEAPRFEMGHGGKGANQAVAAARLGSDVLMITKVGDDTFGKATLENFKANGIDTRHVGIVEGLSSGVAPIFVEPSGENSILIIKGANNELKPKDVDKAAAELAKADLILMQMEIPVETVYHVIAWAKEAGVRTLLNPAPAVDSLDPERIKDVSFLVPNETELAILSGMKVDSRESTEAAARSLMAKGIGTVIVTMGGKGALLFEADRTLFIEPLKVTPVDTTGAGDAFIGSFAHFLCDGLPVEDALKTAARYAAHSITRRGTQKSYGTLAELQAFLPV